MLSVLVSEDLLYSYQRYHLVVEVSFTHWSALVSCVTHVTWCYVVYGECLMLQGADEAAIFRPLVVGNVSVMKLACEPVNPAELPKMVEVRIQVDIHTPYAHTSTMTTRSHARSPSITSAYIPDLSVHGTGLARICQVQGDDLLLYLDRSSCVGHVTCPGDRFTRTNAKEVLDVALSLSLS